MHNTNYDWHDKLIGRYQLRQMLGAGGMGTVWLATDTQLRRQVAIKLLPAVLTQNRGHLNDFAHEARASASLEHPHILAIHDFGEHETAQGEIIPYLVMPYVADGTLRTRIDAGKGKIPVMESLYYLRQAGLAIDYAHSKHILHRDIKPANMLLDKEWLFLSDFGIAKILNSISHHDKTYSGAGTPEYMAPEQIEGHAGPASDRYSLAIIAYQLFTGHRPFHSNTPYGILALQMKYTPTSPRQLNASLPQSVERVLMQSLARQPEQRPASCAEFVDALEKAWSSTFATGQDPDSTLLSPWSKHWQERSNPPSIRPGFMSEQQSQPEQHLVNTPSDLVIQLDFDQMPLSTSHATQLPATSFTPSTPSMMTQPQAVQDKVSQPLEQKPGRRKLLISGLGGAAVLAISGTVAAMLLHKHTTPTPPAPRPLGPKKLIPAVAVLKLTGHKDEVWGAQWDPSGRYLLTSGVGANLMLWDIATFLKQSATINTIATPTHTFTVAGIDFKDTNSGICWSPDGSKLVVGQTASSTFYVLNVSNLNTPIPYTESNANDAFYFSVCPGPGKDFFTVANGARSEAQIWHFGKTTSPQNKFLIDSKNPDSLDNFLSQMQWSLDGKTLAALDAPLSGSSSLILWPNKPNASPQKLLLPARPTGYTIATLAATLAWSPTDPHLLLLSNGDIAYVWDVPQKKIVLTLGATTDPSIPLISALSWSPNGRYIAGSYTPLGGLNDGVNKMYNPSFYIWDIDQLKKTVKSPDVVQQPTHTFQENNSIRHTQAILDLHWSPNGRYLATSSLDTTVIVWNVDGG